MNRIEAREQCMVFVFENLFTGYLLEEIIENSNLKYIDPYTREVFNGILDNLEKIDFLIEDNLNNWNKNRISKICLSILRVCVYELMFRKDIPVNVSINEAIELAKKYGEEQESKFINGILGAISRNLELGEKIKIKERIL